MKLSEARANKKDFIHPLKLNMQMLVDEFVDRNFEPVFCHHQRDKMKLETCMVYFGQKDLRENVLYICPAAVLKGKPVASQDICLVVYGESEGEIREIPNPILFFQNADPAILMNEINDIFHRYHEFEMRLYEALYNGGLSALSNVALSFFKNPMQVHDEKFILLSRPQYVSGMTEVDYDEKTGISSFKLDLINTLKYDKDYIKTLSARGAHFWIKPYLTPYRVMYVNLFDRNNRYRGRVILNEINSIFHPSHFQMLEYFAEFVLRAVTATSRREKDKTYVSFEMLLKHCLKGSWPSREMALKAISLYNWQEEDTYLCVKILIPNNNREINSEDILVISLMLLFKQCKVFVDNNYIWLVENLSAEKMTLETFQEKMREFSKEGAYHCGQSAVFHDFFRMTQGFQQASMALKFSRKYQPDVLYTPFSDIVNRYLMSRIREDISVETICHEKLLFLQEYDAKKGTDHFHTLRVYLENERNLTLVSSLLHVHRSTLQYRIEKLEELTELPLDDAELRFYLLCCFRLLDEVREAGTAGPSSPPVTAAVMAVSTRPGFTISIRV